MKAKLLIFLLLGSINCISQDSLKNAVFLELGGNALFYSFNFEHQFKNQWVGRAGFSFTSNSNLFPLTFGKFWGTGKHHLEVSPGATFISYKSGTTILLTGFTGYRYQKPGGDFLFRAGLIPFLRLYDYYKGTGEKEYGDPFLLWGGLSVGYRFK